RRPGDPSRRASCRRPRGARPKAGPRGPLRRSGRGCRPRCTWAVRPTSPRPCRALPECTDATGAQVYPPAVPVLPRILLSAALLLTLASGPAAAARVPALSTDNSAAGTTRTAEWLGVTSARGLTKDTPD